MGFGCRPVRTGSSRAAIDLFELLADELAPQLEFLRRDRAVLRHSVDRRELVDQVGLAHVERDSGDRGGDLFPRGSAVLLGPSLLALLLLDVALACGGARAAHGRTSTSRGRRRSALVVLTDRRASKVGFGHRTLDAQRSFSKPRRTAADGSSWWRPLPCRASAGKAWWALCHDSPKLTTLSHAMLALRSAVRYGRRPTMCPSEFTLQVTWWSRTIRTAPAHIMASVAPSRERVTAQPMENGRRSDRAAHSGASREITTRSRSASRSLLHRAGFDCVPSNNHPMCAWKSPRSRKRVPGCTIQGE